MVTTELQKLLNNPTELTKLVQLMLSKNRVVWSNYDRQKIEEVIKHNSYVFSAIQKIAKACVNIQFLVGRSDNDGGFTEDKNNPLYKILKSPSPIMDGVDFKEQGAFWYYGFGELFLYGMKYEAGNDKGKVTTQGLMYCPPQITDIVADGIVPTGYVINSNITKAFPINNVLHLKAFNPDWEDLHGLPFIAVAGRLIDKLDSADETEVKNFQNGGPAYIASAKEASSYSKEEHESLIDMLKRMWKNPKNKGGIAGTSGVINIQAVGKSPVELGTIESTKNTLRMLCAVWGLDPGLFDTEASTYNNKQEINKAIYTEAAIPFMERFASKLTAWLGEAYGGVEVRIDTSNVEVLQPNNQAKVQWMSLAGVYTDNEIREATGYDSRESDLSDLTPNEALSNDPSALYSGSDLDKPIVDKPALGVSTEIQSTALNGAQISSLLEVINSVGQQQISSETARAIILAAFPAISPDIIDDIISGIEKYKPKPLEQQNQQ
jgi:HK97 family phage portal protein